MISDVLLQFAAAKKLSLYSLYFFFSVIVSMLKDSCLTNDDSSERHYAASHARASLANPHHGGGRGKWHCVIWNLIILSAQSRHTARVMYAVVRSMSEVCGLPTQISTDPDLQIFLWTRTVRGSAKQTHSRTRTICRSKATSIVCRTNLERKCQCISSQQFENWSIFGNCSRLCRAKKACLTVWGHRHCLLDTV